MTDEFDHLFAERVRATLGGDAYGTWRAIAEAEAAPLHFGFPFPDSFPTAKLQTAVEGVLDEEGARALQYGGGEYAERLADAVAAREADRGVDHADEGVVVTGGSSHALDLVCRAFLDPGDAIVVEAPTFMGALSIVRDHDVTVLDVPMDEGGLDVDALADLLAAREAAGEPTPKFVYTIPNFQNPAGVTLPADRRERLLELAAEHDFLVVEDDAYGDLRYDGDPVPPLAALPGGERAVRMGTFSKTIAPGVRTGWLTADPAIADELDRINAGGASTFVRSVLGYYFEQGHFEPVLADLRAAYADRRDHLLDRLEREMPAGTDWTEPDGGFFVWVELPAGVDADGILDDALDAGVAYLPGSMFYPGDDDRGRRNIRLSFSHADEAAIEAGVEVLGAVTRDALEEP